MTDFQRARSPEQREARRRAILGAAAELLAEAPLAEISLRELARRVGLSKTNVVRYFETREAVFFALLNQAIEDWLAELPADLPADDPAAVPGALARSLAARPLLCELWSSLGTELERNISADAVRDFKLTHSALQARLAVLLTERIPALTGPAAREFVALTILLLAGLWPFANPAPAVAEAVTDPRLAHSRVDFPARLGRALEVTLTGLLALG